MSQQQTTRRNGTVRTASLQGDESRCRKRDQWVRQPCYCMSYSFNGTSTNVCQCE